MPYAQWLAEKKGQPTWKTVIQQDVDAAAISALTWKQFLWILGQQGYTFQLNRKYFTLRPPGKERPVRFKTLGPDYTPEAIQHRILETQPPLPAGKRTAPVRRFTLRAGTVSYTHLLCFIPAHSWRRTAKTVSFPLGRTIRLKTTEIQEVT